ncbi:hypothetical protein BJV74DRAFT_797626 [Russula compacta]|nr:hypothetical protein BJV74DRAFT_797626 [Russula compacta]
MLSEFTSASPLHPIQQDPNTDESPWDDAPSAPSTTLHAHAEAEWTRLTSTFQNAGYRDGITAGKEGALQEGFDAGFAQAGAPRGRELGLLRGLATALLLHLSRTRAPARARQMPTSPAQEQEEEEGEAQDDAATILSVREIVDLLATVRFVDIAPPPPPEEAEHAHTHTHGVGASSNEKDKDKEEEEEEEVEEERVERRTEVEGEELEQEQEEVGQRSSSSRPAGLRRRAVTTTTIEDLRALRVKLEALLRQVGLQVDLNLNPEPRRTLD